MKELNGTLTGTLSSIICVLVYAYFANMWIENQAHNIAQTLFLAVLAGIAIIVLQGMANAVRAEHRRIEGMGLDTYQDSITTGQAILYFVTWIVALVYLLPHAIIEALLLAIYNMLWTFLYSIGYDLTQSTSPRLQRAGIRLMNWIGKRAGEGTVTALTCASRATAIERGVSFEYTAFFKDEETTNGQYTEIYQPKDRTMRVDIRKNDEPTLWWIQPYSLEDEQCRVDQFRTMGTFPLLEWPYDDDEEFFEDDDEEEEVTEQ